MFSTNSTGELAPYNFESDENSQKWRGIFKVALQKVQRQVGPQQLTARDDALDYTEGLILQLLGMLCNSQPHTIQDVEDRVQEKFPHPIDKWAISDAGKVKSAEKGSKKKTSNLVLPADKIHPLLVKEVLGYKIDFNVSQYIVAVLEYIAADILKLTGKYVNNMKHDEITRQDIQVAMCADKVLMDMFFQDDEVSVAVEEEPASRVEASYEDIVKDLILDETQYMRDLNMIIKVFRAPFVQLFPRSKDLEVIFSNVIEIQELTANLISNVEDTLEMTDNNCVPYIGNCFEDMAETAEFDVYERYTEDVVKPHARERLNTLLQRPDTAKTFQNVGQGFKDSVKYVLPKLLMGPIYHFLHYFDTIKALIEASREDSDKECLEQATGLLRQHKLTIEKKISGLLPKKKKVPTATLR